MSDTPLSDQAIEMLPRFFEMFRARLETGKKEYGDRSFLRDTSEIDDEIDQELLDIVGWAYVRWASRRLRRVTLRKPA